VSWEDVFENGTSGSQTVPLQPSFLERQPDTIGVLGKRENQILGQLFTSNFGERQEFGGHPQVQEEWKVQSYFQFIEYIIGIKYIYFATILVNENHKHFIVIVFGGYSKLGKSLLLLCYKLNFGVSNRDIK
jgi:hypothetical protein